MGIDSLQEIDKLCENRELKIRVKMALRKRWGYLKEFANDVFRNPLFERVVEIDK